MKISSFFTAITRFLGDRHWTSYSIFCFSYPPSHPPRPACFTLLHKIRLWSGSFFLRIFSHYFPNKTIHMIYWNICLFPVFMLFCIHRFTLSILLTMRSFIFQKTTKISHLLKSSLIKTIRNHTLLLLHLESALYASPLTCFTRYF